MLENWGHVSSYCMEQHSKEYYELVEKLLSTSFNMVRQHIPEQDCDDIQVYIDHGEYGVGWELLWHLVHKLKLPIPDELVDCGIKMGFVVSRT